MNDQYLSTSQAARELGVSSELVRQWTKSGKLASVTTPLGRLVPATAALQMKEARRARSSSEDAA